jgi:hypothetical protein
MSSRCSSPGVQRVCPRILRSLFNRRQLVEQAQRGEILVVTVRSYLTPPAAQQEPGTRTEKVEYYDRSGRRLAIAVQYVRPDGSLGASGLPDPKWLHDGSRVLIPSHRDDQTCPDCLAAATAP